MGIFDKYNDLVLSYFKRDEYLSGARFIQYIHNILTLSNNLGEKYEKVYL